MEKNEIGSDLCFVICPIGSPDSSTRKRADQVFEYVIKPVVKPLKLKPFRPDQFSLPGMISSQIIESLVNAPLVIADLTERNANVFYELAIRHLTRKPIIHICQEGEKLPFDISDVRTIYFDYLKVESVKKCRKEMKRQIKVCLRGDYRNENPVSRFLDFERILAMGRPERAGGARTQAMLKELMSRVSQIHQLVSNPINRNDILRELWNHQKTLSILKSRILGLKKKEISEKEYEGIVSAYNGVVISIVQLIEAIPQDGQVLRLRLAVSKLGATSLSNMDVESVLRNLDRFF